MVNSASRFDIVTPDSANRAEIEAYIAERYQQAFNATITTFMPYLSCLRGQDDRLLSVCGYRPAAYQPLFLEQYLTDDVADVLSAHYQQVITRNSVIEFGQLASFSSGTSLLHFHALANRLLSHGYLWCVFTATGPLYALMRRFGLEPHLLTDAEASRLQPATDQWGNYYTRMPRVCAGNLAQGAEQLARIVSKQCHTENANARLI
ncbi:thermostable hemolysin [Salinivibrio kushneri]|uniref:thermostable hemolysin n=1 Tax=Salinivibrio kushneri TaxID=1908198 RepID=UPI0009887E4B|nr:thermostable hemolysin [Salinivibrio kushneri]OOE50475.1 hypothetical protein BZG12_14150 [Salinivibrio kushneri]